MHRYKFNADLIDANGQIVANCGIVYINVGIGSGTGSISRALTVDSVYAWLQSYMDINALLNFVNVLTPVAYDLPEQYLDNFRKVIPITTVMSDLPYSEYRMRLSNDSGKYAISRDAVTSHFNSIATWDLYNSDDALALTQNSAGMPLCGGSTFHYFIASDNDYSDNTLRSARYDVTYQSINPDIVCNYINVSNIRSPEILIQWLKGLSEDPIDTDDDPYSEDPDGHSDEGGGEGDFDGDSDPIDIPPLPDLSAVDTGFIALFNPSVSQLQALANYMWSSGFDLDTFKKLFADPMSCILGLSIVPVNVPSGGSSAVTVGNISTGVSMPKASRQYVEVDCGTLNVNEYWGAYLDYDPYTKAELYLPYIGTHPIAVDDIMTKAVHVVYHVDILSGACIAYVKCGESVLYSFIGHCSSSIPITGNDWTNVINGVLGIAGAVGTMVATGGASAPYAMASIASTAVNSLKPTVEKSGSLSGTGGIMGIQKPYLILTRPRQALPARQNKFIGYPSFITVNISDLTGYTEIESVHLEGIPATDDELSEIESILKSGVIF